MALDLTGISNHNEFFFEHYLAALSDQYLTVLLPAIWRWLARSENAAVRLLIEIQPSFVAE